MKTNPISSIYFLLKRFLTLRADFALKVNETCHIEKHCLNFKLFLHPDSTCFISIIEISCL